MAGPVRGPRFLAQSGRVQLFYWRISRPPKVPEIRFYQCLASSTHYPLRPAVTQDRLRLLDDGRVMRTLKTAWADGTRQLLFEPLELLEKLAAVSPCLRINLVLYHGVLAPYSSWRVRVVAYGAAPAEALVVASAITDANDEPMARPVVSLLGMGRSDVIVTVHLGVSRSQRRSWAGRRRPYRR